MLIHSLGNTVSLGKAGVPAFMENTVPSIDTADAQDAPEQYAPDCPVCSGESSPLGQLGALTWFRCRRCGVNFSSSSQRARLTTSAKPLSKLAEPLVAISTAHLRAATRQQLANDELSVPAYPNDSGGFVYVGTADDTEPLESELAVIIKAARAAGFVWIKFDANALQAEGFTIFDDEVIYS